MEKYQALFDHGAHSHYLVFDNQHLVGVFDNIKDMCQMILSETNGSRYKIKELYTNKWWIDYKKNLKIYSTVNKDHLHIMSGLIKMYMYNDRCLGIYELLFLKFMLNPELLVGHENLVRIVKQRNNDYMLKYRKNELRYSKIMFEFKKFLRFALRRYDAYCYRPYNLRIRKNKFVY